MDTNGDSDKLKSHIGFILEGMINVLASTHIRPMMIKFDLQVALPSAKVQVMNMIYNSPRSGHGWTGLACFDDASTSLLHLLSKEVIQAASCSFEGRISWTFFKCNWAGSGTKTHSWIMNNPFETKGMSIVGEKFWEEKHSIDFLRPKESRHE